MNQETAVTTSTDGSKELGLRQERFALALARGERPVSAAQIAGVNERTGWRWLQEEEILLRAEWLRKRLMRQWANEGFGVVRMLAHGPEVSDAVRLNAAKVLISGGISEDSAGGGSVLVLELGVESGVS